MKLVLIYTLIAAVVALITAPIPGTSLLLTALEIYMIVHLAKVHDFKLGLKEIGYSAIALWGISTVLKDAALEVLAFFPGIRLDCGIHRGGVIRFLSRKFSQSIF